MNDNTTLDAAIVTKELDAALQSASDAIEGQGWSPRSHIYAIALIAKLIEGMEPPTMHDRIHPGIKQGFDFAVTEIRRRVGLEVRS
jgi:hypothetical protein